MRRYLEPGQALNDKVGWHQGPNPGFGTRQTETSDLAVPLICCVSLDKLPHFSASHFFLSYKTEIHPGLSEVAIVIIENVPYV